MTLTLHIITKYNKCTLQGAAVSNFLNILPVITKDNVSDVNVVTAGLLEELYDMPTGPYFTPEFKKEFIEMFQKLKIGELFFLNMEWYSLSPAKVLFARKYLKKLESGKYYKTEARFEAIEESRMAAMNELKGG